MIVSILQPYFFPYIGYFQLIALSDVCVLFDEVKFSKQRWMNRNRIAINGRPNWITLPVVHASSSLPINQRFYVLDSPNIARLLRQIEAAYRRALRFADVFPLVEEIMHFGAPNVAEFNGNLVRRIAGQLGIGTRFLSSSELHNDHHLTGQDRVIEICQRLDATQYVNPIGGMKLYKDSEFARRAIQLRFLETTVSPISHSAQVATSYLSIIDTLMSNDETALVKLLMQYRLIAATGEVMPMNCLVSRTAKSITHPKAS